MFADDTKIYKEIKSRADAASLQADLDRLDASARPRVLTRKPKPVVTERDLQVFVAKDLTWNRQVFEQTSKANKLSVTLREIIDSFEAQISGDLFNLSDISGASLRLRDTNMGSSVSRTYS